VPCWSGGCFNAQGELCAYQRLSAGLTAPQAPLPSRKVADSGCAATEARNAGSCSGVPTAAAGPAPLTVASEHFPHWYS
jgi:hypothetical protein